MEYEVVCVFLDGDVSIQIQLFELKSGDWKAEVQQRNLFFPRQPLNTTRRLKAWIKNARRVCAGTVLQQMIEVGLSGS